MKCIHDMKAQLIIFLILVSIQSLSAQVSIAEATNSMRNEERLCKVQVDYANSGTSGKEETCGLGQINKDSQDFIQSGFFHKADSINIRSVSLMYDLSYYLSNQEISIYWDTLNVTEKWGIHPEAVNIFEDLRSNLSPLSDKALREYDVLELPLDYTFDFFENGSRIDTLSLYYTVSNEYWTEKTMNLVFRLSRISRYYNKKIGEYCYCSRMIKRSAYYYSRYKDVSISISDLESNWIFYSNKFGSGNNEAELRQMAELFAFAKLASINKIQFKDIIDFIKKHNVSIEKIREYSEFLDDEYKECARLLIQTKLSN